MKFNINISNPSSIYFKVSMRYFENEIQYQQGVKHIFENLPSVF